MNTFIPLLGEFDVVMLLPFAIFGLAAIVVWILLERWAATSPRSDVRLEAIKRPRAARGSGGRALDAQPDKATKVIEKAAPALAKALQPKSEKEVSNLKVKLANAGFRGELAPNIFLGLKFVGLIAGFFITGGTMLITEGATKDTLIYTVGVAGVLFYLPGLFLWLITRGRQEKIFLGLPDTLDLMVVCVEAGLALDQAMRKVSEEMVKAHPVIAEEFRLANLQLQMGRSRTEVLRELGTRTGVDDVKSLAAILIQADKFGSSIAQALRVQSDSMRTRRRQLAEEKAAKTAVKLIFPLVIFIFPGIFVILVGPAAITMVREMFPKMNG